MSFRKVKDFVYIKCISQWTGNVKFLNSLDLHQQQVPYELFRRECQNYVDKMDMLTDGEVDA